MDALNPTNESPVALYNQGYDDGYSTALARRPHAVALSVLDQYSVGFHDGYRDGQREVMA